MKMGGAALSHKTECLGEFCKIQHELSNPSLRDASGECACNNAPSSEVTAQLSPSGSTYVRRNEDGVLNRAEMAAARSA
jgi:hypothetical protein